MLLTQYWFWYLGQQMEEISGTPKTLRKYYKRGEAISKNHSAIRNESKKII